MKKILTVIAFLQLQCAGPVININLEPVDDWKTDSWEQPDGRHKDEPIWSPSERLLMVQSNRYADEAFLYLGEEKLYEYLEKNQDRIDVRIIGEDHKGRPYTGEGLDIEIVFNSRDHNYSTINTINKIIDQRVK